MGFLEIWNLFLFRPINLYVSLDIIVMANEFVAQCVKIYSLKDIWIFRYSNKKIITSIK